MEEASDTTRRLQRTLFRVATAAWFVALAFWFGPNVILFHKLARPSPDDFVPIVEKYCVPAVSDQSMVSEATPHRRLVHARLPE